MMRTPNQLKHLLNATWLASIVLAFSTGIAAQNQVLQPIQWFLKKQIEVHVQDTDGHPIEEFEYAIIGGAHTTLEPRADGSLPRFKHVSDPLGVARAELRPHYYKGKWKVTVAVGAPGCVTRFHTIEPERLTETVVLLERAGRVFGKVIDSAGNPVAGARVWLGQIPYPGHHGRSAHIMESDSSGKIASDQIPIGSIPFAILHPDVIADVHEREVSGDKVNEFVFTLDAGATLMGTLSFGVDLAESGGVNIQTSDQSTPMDRRTESRQGRFNIKGIASGTSRADYHVRRSNPGFRDTVWRLSEELQFVEHEVKRIQVEFPSGLCRLGGRILAHGSPPPSQFGASIYLSPAEPQDARSLQVDGHTNEEGNYDLTHLPAGSWRMTVHTWDSERQEGFNFQKTIVLSEGEPVRLDINFPEDATK